MELVLPSSGAGVAADAVESLTSRSDVRVCGSGWIGVLGHWRERMLSPRSRACACSKALRLLFKVEAIMLLVVGDESGFDDAGIFN